jgi:exodeoxyribonuclease VII large subunit
VSDATQDDLTVDRALASVGDAIDSLIGEITVVGAVHGATNRRGWNRLELANHLGTQISARLPVGCPPAVSLPGGCSILENAEVAVTGRFEVHPRHGPLQFVASNVVILSGRTIAADLTESTLAELRKTGRIDANRSLALSDRPQRIGLIAPRHGGAGGADFLNRINDAEEVVQISSRYIPMVGEFAVEALVDAIQDFGVSDAEVIFICRGGGAKTELAIFDSPQVLDAIASSPIPLIVGVGHSTDTTATDLVCYASLPTPSAAADWLIARRQDAQRERASEDLTRRTYAAARSQAQAEAHMMEARAVEHSASATIRRTMVLASALFLLALIAIVIVV